MEHCPCGTGNTYVACCGRFLSGEQTATSPEELMRSRYTAYTLVNPEYISQTMVAPAALNFSAENMREMAKDTIWAGLEVLHAAQHEQHGQVEFIASYYQDDEKHHLHERSEFILMDGKWFYRDGVTPNARVGRNDPCPCGSGKKHKKCCLA